jgi:ArsR family transcriptional regulator|uniref:ArsR family transcriptional regulator n=1 Tax=Dictyoglomus turgidum TaxID=513050 RepID=A0A7C3WV90_9BACT
MKNKENYSDETLQNMSDLLKILAHPIRIKLLLLLSKEPNTVSELLKILDVRQPNLSQHLTLLKRVKILKTKRDGKSVYYHIAYPEIQDIINKVKELSEKIAK